jgi:hypothetical protein
VHVKALKVHDEAQNRLYSTDRHQRDVSAPPPETPPQPADDECGHDGQNYEAGDVIAKGQVGAANCARGKQMSE